MQTSIKCEFMRNSESMYLSIYVFKMVMMMMLEDTLQQEVMMMVTMKMEDTLLQEEEVHLHCPRLIRALLR